MTRPLAIAVVCYPGLGGSGVVASELAHGLALRGHRVHVLATALPERATAVQFEPIEVPRSPVYEHAPYCLAVASHLVSLARRAPLDVVHLHYAVPHAASALLAAQVLGDAAPAMVMTLHGTDATRLATHPGVQPVTAFAIAACDAITVPSPFLRREAAAKFALPADRIQVIPNFVDLERFAPPAVRREPAAPVLFHVSNFRPIKRPQHLPEVLERVRRVVPEATMVLVGDGPERAATEARAAELGLAGAMRFLGRRTDFEAELAHADGFVLTSESESFGVAALEAMAAGVPVFGYAVGGLPEVLGDATGALVPSGDRDALAAAIAGAIRDRPRRDAMGRAARARAEARYGSAHALTAYEAVFRRVLAARTRTTGAALR